MVSDVVLGAGVGVLGTLLGTSVSSYINYRRTKIRLEEESNRVRAQIHSEKEVEYLIKQFSEIQQFRSALAGLNHLSEYSKEQFDSDSQAQEMLDESLDQISDFYDKSTQNRVFLTEFADDQLKTAISLGQALSVRVMADLTDESVDDIVNEVPGSLSAFTGDLARHKSPEELNDDAVTLVNELEDKLRDRIQSPVEHFN